MAQSAGTGVIIGRFQVFELNDVLRALIGRVQAAHENVVIFLGSNPAPSDQNPLELPLRSEMLLEAYEGQIEILEMPDLPDDRIWSQELDRRIMDLRPAAPVLLYGTQEGLADRYSGKYPVEVLEAEPDDIPDLLNVDGIRHLGSFRAGIIYATMRRYPTVYPTVDIAVFDTEYKHVLLARKENESKFRFPGGFTDPEDESYEMAALRELAEECGEVEVDEMAYIGSCKIDDWRYLGSLDSIITHLYVCVMLSGEPEPNDDITELKWFDVSRLQADIFVPEHRPLFELLEVYLQEEH